LGFELGTLPGVIQHPPAEQKTSTQEIRAVLDELIGHNKS
jgi:hypothetical protein